MVSHLPDDAQSVASSEFSLFEALSSSEKIINGNVTLDWRSLPTSVVNALPDPPPSARKHMRRRIEQQKQSSVDEDISFIEEKLAKWTAKASLNRDGAVPSSSSMQNRTITSLADASRASLAKTDILGDLQPISERQPGTQSQPRTHEKGEKIFQFTNCQFSYGSTRDASASMGNVESSSIHDPDNLLQRREDTGNASPVLGRASISRTKPLSGDNAEKSDDELSVTELGIRSSSPARRDVGRDTPILSKSLNLSSTTVRPSVALFMLFFHPAGSLIILILQDNLRSTNSKRSFASSKDAMLDIYAELRDLAARLKVYPVSFQVWWVMAHIVSQRKSHSLKAREAQIAKREGLLKLDESQVLQEVDRLVDTRVKATEASWRQETEAVVNQYEEALHTVTKENRRAQSSLKELITANKSLRDQVATLQAESNNVRRELEDKRFEAKQCHDRNQRLRKTLEAMRSSVPTADVHKDRARKPLKYVPLRRKATCSAETQTYEEYKVEPSSVVRVHRQTSSLCRIIAGLLRQHTSRHLFAPSLESTVLYECLDSVLDMVSTSSRTPSAVDVEPCLEFVLHALRHSDVEPAQKMHIARLAYERLAATASAGAAQPNLLAGALDALVNSLSTDEVDGYIIKRTCVALGGVGVLYPLLQKSEMGQVSFLASSVMMALCAHGDWLEEFLEQCSTSAALEAIATAMESHHIPTLENLSVVVHKVARIPKNQNYLRVHPFLVPRMRVLSCIDEQDMSVTDNPGKDSEFLRLNARSTLRTLGVTG
ncbi:hypothetical protein BC832DRAFT_536814 [Gaertneriomyces semiglobifer]|nr:hypothetical protein BC832DRAFT_536814 [Gaertneriomyces semiglobifer]